MWRERRRFDRPETPDERARLPHLKEKPAQKNAQKRRLSFAGRPDQCNDFTWMSRDIDVGKNFAMSLIAKTNVCEPHTGALFCTVQKGVCLFRLRIRFKRDVRKG